MSGTGRIVMLLRGREWYQEGDWVENNCKKNMNEQASKRTERQQKAVSISSEQPVEDKTEAGGYIDERWLACYYTFYFSSTYSM